MTVHNVSAHRSQPLSSASEQLSCQAINDRGEQTWESGKFRQAGRESSESSRFSETEAASDRVIAILDGEDGQIL